MLFCHTSEEQFLLDGYVCGLSGFVLELQLSLYADGLVEYISDSDSFVLVILSFF